MNVQIEQLLRRRADRADNQPDTEQVLASVRELVDRRRRRRRSLAAAGSGAAVVAGVVALIAVVTPGSGGGTSGQQAGGVGLGGPAATTSAARPTASHGSNARVTTSPAASATTSQTTSPAPTNGRLEKAASTPKAAPLAVTLVPEGWKYLAAADDATTYGPRGANRDRNDWRGKLALIVSESYNAPIKGPLTIVGHPATLTADSDLWHLIIQYNASVRLEIQLPTSAHLSRDKVIQLSNSLVVRDVSSPAHG